MSSSCLCDLRIRTRRPDSPGEIDVFRVGRFCCLSVAYPLFCRRFAVKAQENTAKGAEELNNRILELYQQGKYAEAIRWL